MGVTRAVHRWEESQMRVLVLSSLVFQFLLLIFTYLRTWTIPGWLRFIMWLAYLGGDAIAIYALATLFNRHKDQDRGINHTLEVVWAPILLIHLGGHDGITAYDIEDNELWSRHLLTAVSQVTVAVYAFYKSWPPGGDKRLLQAAIVLFVPGVLKCFAKPWALRRASIKSLVSSPAARSTKKQKEDITRLEAYVQRRAKASVQEHKDEGDGGGNPNRVPSPQRCSGDIPPTQACPRRRRRQRKRDAQALHGKQNDGEMDAFERYMEGAMAFVREQQKDGLPSQQGHDISSSQHHRQVKEKEIDLNMILNGEAYKLFVDLSSPYPLRLSIFKYFWALSEETAEKAYASVRQGLATAFILLYTKVKVSFIALMKTQPDPSRMAVDMNMWFAYFVMASREFLPWAAIGLFHHSHREVYSGVDVKITYALFCCTAILEIYSQSIIIGLVGFYKEQWPMMVAQYNLIGYYARNKKHHKKMWTASKSGCKDLVDQHWRMGSCFSSGPITKLVLEYLKAGWKEKIHDPVSYHKFNDNRGQWALERYEDELGCSIKGELGWSIRRPFDESVLLWHIATDFCFFWRTPPGNNKAVQCSRQMSNYMVYLLFVNPEMLLPGARRNLFTVAWDELKDILGDNKPSLFAKLNDILMDNQQDANLRVRIRTAMKELKDVMDNEQNLYRRRVRTRTAMRELKGILRDNKPNPTSRSEWKHAPLTEEVIIQRVISSIRDKSTQASEGQESKQGFEDSESELEDGQIQELEEEGCKHILITNAWALAQQLLALGDEKMWKMIQGVWVEMLCFSASRCRGYLHAKSLGSGGEFLSYVWLLRFYMGMETFSERLQREELELPSREPNNSGAPPPSDADNGDATTSSSTSRVHSRAAPSPFHLGTDASPSNSDIRIAID